MDEFAVGVGCVCVGGRTRSQAHHRSGCSSHARRARSHKPCKNNPPPRNEVRGSLPSNCAYPPDSGGGFLDPLWVSTFVDDALFVEMEHMLRCLLASQSFASDSVFRLFGTVGYNSDVRLTAQDTCMHAAMRGS